MTKTEMTKKIRELKKLKIEADKLSAEISAIEDSLKAELINRNVDEMVVDVFRVRYKTVVSNRFDTTKFKKRPRGYI